MTSIPRALVLVTVSIFAGIANARTLQGAGTYTSLYDLLSSTPELQQIVQLFNHTGLLPLIKDRKTKITCFFPSNKYAEAAALLADDRYGDLVINRWVWPVLLHHCLGGQTARTLDQLQSKSYRSAFTWRHRVSPILATSDLSIKKTSKGTIIRGEAYNEAKIITPNLRGGKSIVHMTQGDWLIPEVAPPDSFASIFEDFLTDYFELSTASRVFRASRFAAELADPKKPLTIFAPSDNAFIKLLSKLGVTLEQLVANKEVVDMIVGTHVLRGSYLYQGALLSYKQAMKLQMLGGPVHVTTDMAIFPRRSGPAQFLTISTPYSSAHIGSYDIGGNGNDIDLDNPPVQWVGHFLDDVLLPASLTSIKAMLN